jgi:hypothetical protein
VSVVLQSLFGEMLMVQLQIEWSWDHLPRNTDMMEPMGTVEVFGKEMLIAKNVTQDKLLFVWDGNYGVLVKGKSNATV